MTVNAINGTLFTALSALDGITLSTLTAVDGQTILAGPVTLIFDDFNRADSGSLGTCTGGTQAPQAWATGGNGTQAISSNHTNYTHGSTGSVAWLNVGTADCTIQATFTTTKQNNGLWFRGDGQDGFLFVNEGGTKYSCYKVLSGSFTQVFNGAGTPTPANGDVLKVVLNGTTIKLYVNGVLKSTFTDSFKQTQPNHGFYGGTASGDDGGQWDDFLVTSATS